MASNQRGLGKGLSALISENYVQPASTKATASAASETSAPAATPAGVTHLSVAQLASGKYQPRTQFDETALSELAESIEKNGIMQPIIVRPIAANGRFEIVAGERRWRAAKIAGLQTVPVIIREITDKQALELALVENVQRQDLSPLEEANGYQRLIEEFDYKQDELATIVGKSRSHIANLLRLLSLPDVVKAYLETGELTAGHARALLGLSNAVELAELIVRKGLNVRQAEAAGRASKGVQKISRPRASASPIPGQSQGEWKPPVNKDPDIVALEESLSENLGVRVSINDRGQSGEIILSYGSLSELDTILRKLSMQADELI